MSWAWQLLYINSRLPKFLTPATYFGFPYLQAIPQGRQQIIRVGQKPLTKKNGTFQASEKTHSFSHCAEASERTSSTVDLHSFQWGKHPKGQPVRICSGCPDLSMPKLSRLLRCVFEGIYMFIFGFSCAYHKILSWAKSLGNSLVHPICLHSSQICCLLPDKKKLKKLLFQIRYSSGVTFTSFSEKYQPFNRMVSGIHQEPFRQVPATSFRRSQSIWGTHMSIREMRTMGTPDFEWFIDSYHS